ncbi:MAG: diacylglycerol kinase family enzyme [Oceanicoccus sp.]|jgi:diacylglycerol kinase family enzyme
MKRALVVYNPISGVKGWKDVPRTLVAELEEHNWDWDWFETVKSEKQALESFLNTKYDRVVVAGGDGTVASVVDFMVTHDMKVPLIIIPQGSANLLAVTLNIPLFHVRKAIRFGLKNPGKRIDVMKVNDKHIGLIAVGQGYDVFLMKETTRALKRHWGLFAYAWVMMKTFVTFRRRSYEITIDGKRHEASSKAVIVFNAFPLAYWKASQLFLGKRIIPNDGELNLFTMGKFWRISAYKGKKIVIKTNDTNEYQIDGDVFSCKTLSIEVMPKALLVVHTNRF